MVYAGNVLVRRLFHDTPVLCFDLLGSHVDWPSISACFAIDDRTRHPPVPQHTEDFQFDTSCSVSVHIYIRLAYGGWNHPFGNEREHL